MTSPQIKILISLASISIIYAFICEIRLTQKARILADLIKNEFPELWQELNLVARNWNGGHPGLKLLYRRKVVDLPNFDREYRRLQTLERQLVLGVITGSVCIGLVALGLFYWGWHW